MSQRISGKAAARRVTVNELVAAVASGTRAGATAHEPSAAVAQLTARPRLLPPPIGDGELGAPTEPPAKGFLDRNAPEVVGVTYWFDPPPQPARQTVVLEIEGRRDPGGDRFQHEERLDNVIAGSGPIAVTAKIRDVAPGEWQLQARFRTRPAHLSADPLDGADREETSPARRATWSWRQWRITETAAAAVKTRIAPLVPAPAVLLGSWLALVVLGLAAGLILQLLLAARVGLPMASTAEVSSLAVAAGVVVAKVWYRVQNRRERSWQGWCLQGFIAGAVTSTPLLAWLFDVAVGPYLDATAAALMLGAAIGRIGCFLTGCCAGRATASRWGIWSSNRAVGARRIPTQLIESALAFVVGAASASALLAFGPRHGTLLAAALASYTLGRQLLLPLREEPRQSTLGPRVIAVIATVVFLADLVAIVRT